MHSHISKWGNSLGVRIPRSIAERLGIAEGAAIELTVEDNHIIIQKSVYHLASLLAQVTAENIHHEEDSGPAAGQEIW